MDPRAGRPRHRGGRPFFEIGLQRLVAYARQEFLLDKRKKDGSTEREHLTSAARQKNAVALLSIARQKALHWSEQYVFDWWRQIRAGVPSSMGVGGIPWTEADAWCRRTGHQPDPDEWIAIRAIDAVYIEVMNADH